MDNIYFQFSWEPTGLSLDMTSSKQGKYVKDKKPSIQIHQNYAISKGKSKSTKILLNINWENPVSSKQDIKQYVSPQNWPIPGVFRLWGMRQVGPSLPFSDVFWWILVNSDWLRWIQIDSDGIRSIKMESDGFRSIRIVTLEIGGGQTMMRSRHRWWLGCPCQMD